MRQFVVNRIKLEQVSHIDLREELARALNDRAFSKNRNGAAIKAYRFVEIVNGYRSTSSWGEILFIPEAGRAGIAYGANADWTDATSAYHAFHLWKNGKMVN